MGANRADHNRAQRKQGKQSDRVRQEIANAFNQTQKSFDPGAGMAPRSIV
jgi:hypothetical protein